MPKATILSADLGKSTYPQAWATPKVARCLTWFKLALRSVMSCSMNNHSRDDVISLLSSILPDTLLPHTTQPFFANILYAHRSCIRPLKKSIKKLATTIMPAARRVEGDTLYFTRLVLFSIPESHY